MLLQAILEQTDDSFKILKSGAYQVFGRDWRYWRLDDYAVSSAVSGPSLILVPRNKGTLSDRLEI